MKPIIGITTSSKDEMVTLNQDNVQSILDNRGVPILLSNVMDQEVIEIIADRIDGLVLSGGGDIDPTLFGEEPHMYLGPITPERDFFEILLSQEMLKLNKPIIGICRGCQILNIAASGDMYQDIYSQMDGPLLQHSQKAPRYHASHFVEVRENSKLSQIVKEAKFKVNSFHHQAVREMGNDFRVVATSSDGVIEAFESSIHKFVMGIQWHPESMIKVKDHISNAIFKAFIKSCYE